MTYTDHGTFIQRDDGACIPLAPGNADYDAYLAWLADGNVPTAPPAPEVVIPTQVTMRQARLALLAAGKLSDVDAAIAALPSPHKEAAQIEWDFAATVERSSPIVAMLEPILGLDAAALDALFTAASAL